jgi:hypothetical protein
LQSPEAVKEYVEKHIRGPQQEPESKPGEAYRYLPPLDTTPGEKAQLVAAHNLSPGALSPDQKQGGQPQNESGPSKKEKRIAQSKDDPPGKTEKRTFRVPKGLKGEALKVEILRQALNVDAATAQRLLQERKAVGEDGILFGMEAFGSAPMTDGFTGNNETVYAVTLDGGSLEWYRRRMVLPKDMGAAAAESDQYWAGVMRGGDEVGTANRAERTLANRGNYGRLLRKLNREKLGQDTVPTRLSDQLPLLSAGQKTIDLSRN